MLFLGKKVLPLQRLWMKPYLLKGTAGKINCIGI